MSLKNTDIPLAEVVQTPTEIMEETRRQKAKAEEEARKVLEEVRKQHQLEMQRKRDERNARIDKAFADIKSLVFPLIDQAINTAAKAGKDAIRIEIVDIPRPVRSNASYGIFIHIEDRQVYQNTGELYLDLQCGGFSRLSDLRDAFYSEFAASPLVLARRRDDDLYLMWSREAMREKQRQERQKMTWLRWVSCF